MDSLITAAARALAAGDPLGALKRIALRDDAPAVALRGIAMAQLGDLVRAKALLRRAARAFGPKEAVARARCVVAEAEIALVSRDLGWPAKALDAARATLEAHGDRANAAYARYLEVRGLLLVGRIAEAERTLAKLDPSPLPPASRTVHELVVAGIAMRRLRTKAARAALARAEHAATDARIPALTAEVEGASRWYFFRRVTLPLLMPTTLFISINALINSFKLVDQLVIMTKGGPNNASSLLLYYIYEVAFTFWDTTYAATLTVTLIAILAAVALTKFVYLDRRIHYQ